MDSMTPTERGHYEANMVGVGLLDGGDAGDLDQDEAAAAGLAADLEAKGDPASMETAGRIRKAIEAHQAERVAGE